MIESSSFVSLAGAQDYSVHVRITLFKRKTIMSVRSEGLNALGSKLKGRVLPGSVDFKVVHIKVGVEGAVATNFREAFVEAVQMELAMSNKTLPVTEEELVSYLNYVVYARVSHVNGDHKCIWKRNDTYMVPAFLHVFLEQIGVVVNDQLGLQLRPEWEGEVPQMDVATLTRVSMFLTAFERQHNVTMRRGLSKSNEGSWETMSFELIEGHVRNTTSEVDPTHSVIASFFAVNGLATVLGVDSFRVTYGPVEQFYQFANEVVNG